MPLTPFHLGPAALLGALAGRRLDPPALLVGSVVVDVRAALVVLGPLPPPVHGPFTTFAGGTVVAAVLTAGLLATYRVAGSVSPLDEFRYRPAATTIFAGALAGTWSHVLLDSVLYADVRPFAPLSGNPFLGLVGFGAVYVGCVLAGVAAAPVAAYRLVRLAGGLGNQPTSR